MEERPRPGLTALPSPHLFFFCTGKRPLLVHSFLCFLLGTRDGEWCQEEFAVKGTLHTDTKVLGMESEQFGSEADLREASMRIAFNLMSLSFLVRGLKSRHI